MAVADAVSWILHNGQSAAGFDRFESLRPVGIGPSQHDADQGLGEDIRRTLEQNIDGGAGIIDARVDGEAQAAIGFDQQMVACRSQVGVTGA